MHARVGVTFQYSQVIRMPADADHLKVFQASGRTGDGQAAGRSAARTDVPSVEVTIAPRSSSATYSAPESPRILVSTFSVKGKLASFSVATTRSNALHPFPAAASRGDGRQQHGNRGDRHEQQRCDRQKDLIADRPRI